MLLNNLNQPEQVLLAFPQDCLDHFKPVVEILAALISWKGSHCEVSLINASIDRIKSFFEQMKRKLYSTAGGARMSQSRAATASLAQIRES